ncbi:hypothetical protein JXA84_07595 [candidate division WOR-3 bacterium]|nr:hypothetical protein [candidate division WOR-3 bacterium]
MKKFSKAFDLLLILAFLYAQQVFSEEFTIEPEESDFQNIYTEFGIAKMELNSCPEESLVLLPYFDRQKALILIESRPYLSVEEALKVTGFSPEQSLLLRNFFYIKSFSKTPSPFLFDFSTTLIHKEFDEESYRVQPFTVSNMMSLKKGNLGFSASTGLDAGEKGYPDFINASISYTEESIGFIAGTQRIRAGAGLVFGNSTFGKVTMPSNLMRLTAYSGGVELGVPVGASLRYKTGFFELTGLSAWRFFDAVFDSAGNATSLYEDGIHVTESEKGRKRNFWTRETDVFLNVENTLLLAGTYARFKSSAKLDDFSSTNDFWAAEAILGKKGGEWDLFGEIAITKTGGVGAYLGFWSYIGKAKIGVSLARYDKNFFSLFSTPPSELGAKNEHGIISSLTVPFEFAKVSLYFDLFGEIEPVGIDKRFRGDLNIDVEKRINRDFYLTISAQNRFMKGEYRGFPGIRPRKEEYSLSMDYGESSLSYHLSYASDSAFNENGEALSIRYKYEIWDWSFLLSAVTYCTSSYASAIYIYQPKIQGSYGFLTATGKGESLRVIAQKKTENWSLSFFADICGKNKGIGIYFDIFNG